MIDFANLTSDGYPVTIPHSIIIRVKLRPIHTSIANNIRVNEIEMVNELND